MPTLAFAALIAATGCDLSYDNSRFTCDGTTPCPSGFSCVSGFCEAVGTSGGGSTGGATTGGTSGGTAGSALCTSPASGLCPPGTTSDYFSCDLGCCQSGSPYLCGTTCYATDAEAAAACSEGQTCSSCVAQWCSSPEYGTCPGSNAGFCGGSQCCDLSTPWFCSSHQSGCYATQSEAFGHCGNTCTYCTPPCTPTTLTGQFEGSLTCANGTVTEPCGTDLPFYCAATFTCFASNAEAYQSCQTDCIACQ